MSVVGRGLRGMCCLLLAIFALLAFVQAVAADMSPPYNYYSSGSGRVLTMFVIGFINFPVNLFWFTAMVVVVLLTFKLGAPPDLIPTKHFIPLLLLGVLFITAAGAVIDSFLLYELNETEDHYVLSFDGYGWAVASILIFASAYAVALLLLKLGYVRSIIPSVALAVLNPIIWSWKLDSYPHGEGANDFALLSAIAGPFVLILATYYHMSRASRCRVDSCPAGEAPKIEHQAGAQVPKTKDEF